MWQRHGADSRAITRYFAKQYGFSLQAPPERLRSAANTRVWSVATPRKYVAKVFLAESAEVLAKEADIMEYVRVTGIRVPEVVPDESGRRIGLLTVGHRLLDRRKLPLYVMRFEEFRPVDSLSIMRAELARVARRMGAMHRALQRYPKRQYVRRIERWSRNLGCFDDFLVSANARSFRYDELARLREIDGALERCAELARWVSCTVESVLHGDFGLHHVGLVDTDLGNEPFFFDFSDFCYGPVAFDLAVMLSYLYWAHDIDFEQWERLREWLLDGYEAELALPAPDRAAIDHLLMERLLIEIRYFNRLSLAQDRACEVAALRRRYRLAAYLLQRSSTMRVRAAPAIDRVIATANT